MYRKLVLAIAVLLLAACARKAGAPAPEVAIYLPATPMSGRDMLAADLGSLQLQPQPVVASDEILSYSGSSHELTLAPSAMKRISVMKVPVQGLGFVVCVDKRPIFAGAFWVLWSSLSFDGLTIDLPIDATQTSVHLYNGYPDVDGVVTGDSRSDPRLLDALEKAGKLR